MQAGRRCTSRVWGVLGLLAPETIVTVFLSLRVNASLIFHGTTCERAASNCYLDALRIFRWMYFGVSSSYFGRVISKRFGEFGFVMSECRRTSVLQSFYGSRCFVCWRIGRSSLGFVLDVVFALDALRIGFMVSPCGSLWRR
jgi:hypothetical protein